MKILSNFNTRLEKDLEHQYREQFGEDKVMTVHKSTMFYRRYVGFPVFVYVTLLIVSFYFFFIEDTLIGWMAWLYVGFFLLYGVVIFSKVSRKWMDYRMDFLIVTPKEIAKYDQSGIFTRHIEKLHADKIKSVSISKSGFLNSMLDIGSIVFLAEGDNEKGDIVMEYVDAVEAQERKIVHVLGLDRE